MIGQQLQILLLYTGSDFTIKFTQLSLLTDCLYGLLVVALTYGTFQFCT